MSNSVEGGHTGGHVNVNTYDSLDFYENEEPVYETPENNYSPNRYSENTTEPPYEITESFEPPYEFNMYNEPSYDIAQISESNDRILNNSRISPDQDYDFAQNFDQDNVRDHRESSSEYSLATNPCNRYPLQLSRHTDV